MITMDNNINNNNSNSSNNNNNNNVVDDDTNMDLDLNQEPIEGSNREGLGTLLDELETAHDQIEERIRRLEAVTARARQRQMWRLVHNRPIHPNPMVPNELKSGKRDSSHLIVTEENEIESGGFFDCNICLETATEPILTCCGHLFCWACFFRLNCLENGAKECPVCKGEVAEAGVTPIYGNGKSAASLAETENGPEAAVVPPRPRARRVEGVRQRRSVARSANLVPLADALRRIRMGISGEERARMRREIGTELGRGGRWRIRTHQFSNVLPDSATSLYSISSALDNAERLVDDLESFVNGGSNGNASSGSQIEGQDVASSSRIRFRFSTEQDNPVSRELRRRRMG